MLDLKMVISQVQQLQIILHDIQIENMSLSKSFQVTAITEKVSPMWKDFKKYLKYKRKEINIENLIIHLRIKEDNQKSDKSVGSHITQAKANVLESNDKNKKIKHSVETFKQGNNKNAKKFKDNCYNCGKAGHRFINCHKPKKQAPANIIESDAIYDGISNMRTCWPLFQNATMLKIPWNGRWIRVLSVIFMLIKECSHPTLQPMVRNCS